MTRTAIAPWGKITTAVRTYRDHGEERALRAEVSYYQLGGNRSPHFSITGTGFRRSAIRGEERITTPDKRTWWADSGGMMHDDIARVFPELAPFLRWHLSEPLDGPMHYVENAVYWAEKVYGCSPWRRESHDPDPRETFDRQVVMGAVDGDEFPAIVTTDDDGETIDPRAMRAVVRERITAWCLARQPALLAALDRDLKLAQQAATALATV